MYEISDWLLAITAYVLLVYFTKKPIDLSEVFREKRQPNNGPGLKDVRLTCEPIVEQCIPDLHLRQHILYSCLESLVTEYEVPPPTALRKVQAYVSDCARTPCVVGMGTQYSLTVYINTCEIDAEIGLITEDSDPLHYDIIIVNP